MVERDRRQLVLWTRTAFWFVALCAALVVVQFGEEGESVGKTFELEDEGEEIFNNTLENELEGQGTVSPDVLREAVFVLEARLKGLESKSHRQWNTTTSRSSLHRAVNLCPYKLCCLIAAQRNSKLKQCLSAGLRLLRDRANWIIKILLSFLQNCGRKFVRTKRPNPKAWRRFEP
jgi:hypothetical protein